MSKRLWRLGALGVLAVAVSPFAAAVCSAEDLGSGAPQPGTSRPLRSILVTEQSSKTSKVIDRRASRASDAADEAAPFAEPRFPHELSAPPGRVPVGTGVAPRAGVYGAPRAFAESALPGASAFRVQPRQPVSQGDEQLLPSAPEPEALPLAPQSSVVAPGRQGREPSAPFDADLPADRHEPHPADAFPSTRGPMLLDPMDAADAADSLTAPDAHGPSDLGNTPDAADQADEFSNELGARQFEPYPEDAPETQSPETQSPETQAPETQTQQTQPRGVNEGEFAAPMANAQEETSPWDSLPEQTSEASRFEDSSADLIVAPRETESTLRFLSPGSTRSATRRSPPSSDASAIRSRDGRETPATRGGTELAPPHSGSGGSRVAPQQGPRTISDSLGAANSYGRGASERGVLGGPAEDAIVQFVERPPAPVAPEIRSTPAMPEADADELAAPDDERPLPPAAGAASRAANANGGRRSMRPPQSPGRRTEDPLDRVFNFLKRL